MVYIAVRVEIDEVIPSRKEGYGEYEMRKRQVLRWERNWVLENESGKDKHCLVVVKLGDVLEKVLLDVGKLFQRIGAVWLHERLDIKYLLLIFS